MPGIDVQKLMREAIQKIAVGPDRGRDISRDDARAIMRAILAQEIDDVQVAVFLIALRMKRESIEEFLGLYDALQASVNGVVSEVDDLICLADPFDGYLRSVTMTPFVPAVLAACDMPALIHGVYSVGPKHGVTAHKVLQLAGVATDNTPAQAAARISEAGWGYVDQEYYASSLHKLGDLRDRIVKRTALTTLERMLMPIRGRATTHLVLGYVHRAYPSIYATVAADAGYTSTLLIKGVEGGLAPALNKPLRQYFFKDRLPEDFNEQKQLIETDVLFDRHHAAMRSDGSVDAVEQCLEEGLKVLDGVAGIARDSLSLAAGHILLAHRRAISLSEAVVKVQNCLDNGSAKACFNALAR